MSLDTVPATWTAGEIPTAAKLNTEIRDALTGIQASWTPYTPTWTNSVTNPVIGNGAITGSYTRFGNTVHYRLKILMGSTTTFGTGASYVMGLPVPSAIAAGESYGTALLTDSSAGLRMGRTSVIAGSSTFYLVDQAGVIVTHVAPFTWAVGDILSAMGTYEAA